MSEERDRLRHRLAEIIEARYGRVEEELMARGVLDSMRAVELALALEDELDLERDSFALADMRTLSALTERVLRCQRGRG